MSSRMLSWTSSQTRQCMRGHPTTLLGFRAISTSQPEAPSSAPSDVPATHFKITLRRSAISLGDKKKGTLHALGMWRRHQTVYQRHTPEAAGKILRVKELVEVENVPEALVKTKYEQTLERRATRGYKVVGSKKDVI